MATTHQASALTLIEEQEQILLRFRTQFVALKAFENELVARTCTRVFNIANTVVWDAILAKRDLLVIHFASWIRGMGTGGGFFGQLGAHHLRELRDAFDNVCRDTVDVGRRRARVVARFSAAEQRGRLEPGDIDDLRSAVRTELEPVVLDRDSFRAHPYERGQKANARMLALTDIAASLDSAEGLLNDLRLLVNNSTFGYSYQSLTSPDDAAADLVDLLLFGSIFRFATLIGANALETTRAYWWQRRDAFLAALRAEQEAQPDVPLNDESLITRAQRRMTAEHEHH